MKISIAMVAFAMIAAESQRIDSYLKGEDVTVACVKRLAADDCIYYPVSNALANCFNTFIINDTVAAN